MSSAVPCGRPDTARRTARRCAVTCTPCSRSSAAGSADRSKGTGAPYTRFWTLSRIGSSPPRVRAFTRRTGTASVPVAARRVLVARRGRPRPGRAMRSRGMPSTRSLMTLRAISVVPPPMAADLAHQEVVCRPRRPPVVVGPGRAGRPRRARRRSVDAAGRRPCRRTAGRSRRPGRTWRRPRCRPPRRSVQRLARPGRACGPRRSGPRGRRSSRRPASRATSSDRLWPSSPPWASPDGMVT